MIRQIDVLFELETMVYLKTDPEQLERMITGICVREKGLISYEVSCGERTGWHYGFELTSEKDVIKKINES